MIRAGYQKTALIDMAAITVSGLCVIHCLALPFIAMILPLAGVVAEAEWAHKALILLAIPFSCLALFQSWGNQRMVSFVLFSLLGLAQLVAVAFIEPLHVYEKLFTLTGAFMLALGHALRLKYHKH